MTSQFSTIQQFILAIIPVLFAITVHEVAHGWMALKLGDKTALMMGRLTLNPVKHIDPIGTILIPTLTYFLGGFIVGWAKPVPVTWENLKHPKRDMALVAFAGPVTNFLMALFWAIVAKISIFIQSKMLALGLALAFMGKIGILVNLILMVLNLIPVPPLDGSRIVTSIIPNRWAYYYNRWELMGLVLLVLLLVTGVLGKIIIPIVQWLFLVIARIVGLG